MGSRKAGYGSKAAGSKAVGSKAGSARYMYIAGSARSMAGSAVPRLYLLLGLRFSQGRQRICSLTELFSAQQLGGVYSPDL